MYINEIDSYLKYGHLSKFGEGIKKGSSFIRNQILAYVGNTGRSTGPHAHVELAKMGKNGMLSIDPLTAKAGHMSVEDFVIEKDEQREGTKGPWNPSWSKWCTNYTCV